MGDAALDRFGFSTVRPGVRVHLAFRRQSPQSQSTPLRLFPPRSGSERDAAPAFIRALACRLLHTGWRGQSSCDPPADAHRKSPGRSGPAFNLAHNPRITVDTYVYEDGGKQNAAVFDITRGTVAFVAAAVAKTGDMTISTPTASLGIRGTTGLVEVPEGASATSANNVAIKLYPDPDGRVGRIEVNDRTGARLGSLTQGASGFAIRPGAGGRGSGPPPPDSPPPTARAPSGPRL